MTNNTLNIRLITDGLYQLIYTTSLMNIEVPISPPRDLDSKIVLGLVTAMPIIMELNCLTMLADSADPYLDIAFLALHTLEGWYFMNYYDKLPTFHMPIGIAIASVGALELTMAALITWSEGYL